MNYKRIYESIIDNAKSKNRKKSKDFYYEKHHIIPKCLGGNDDKCNLVLLTAKEHFICHHLLHKIHPNHRGLAYSFFIMAGSAENRVSSTVYEKAKQLHSKYVTESNYKRILSEETKEKIRKSKVGKSWGTHTEESKLKIKESNTGKSFSEERKQNISKSLSGEKHNFYGKPCSDKRRESIRNSRLKTKKIKCKCCDREFDPGNFKRHLKSKHRDE